MRNARLEAKKEQLEKMEEGRKWRVRELAGTVAMLEGVVVRGENGESTGERLANVEVEVKAAGAEISALGKAVAATEGIKVPRRRNL